VGDYYGEDVSGVGFHPQRREGQPVRKSIMTRAGLRITLGAVLALAAPAAGAQQAPRPGLTQERIDELSHKHDGYYGALAPQNLAKARIQSHGDLVHRPAPGVRRLHVRAALSAVL
jgi:hypothetical protein